MKRWYTLAIQTEPIERIDEELLAAFSGALGAERTVAGAVASSSSVTRALQARVSVQSESIEAALATATAAMRRALRRAKLGDPAISDADVALELPEDKFASARDDLVGTPDVAQRLGISRQRVAQLVEQPGRFPAPVARVRGTHIWRWGDIVDWIAAGQRDRRRRTADYAAMTDDQLLELDRRQVSAAEEHLLARGYRHDGPRWTKPKRAKGKRAA